VGASFPLTSMLNTAPDASSYGARPGRQMAQRRFASVHLTSLECLGLGNSPECPKVKCLHRAQRGERTHDRRCRRMRCRWYKTPPRFSLTFSPPLPGRLSMTAESGPKPNLDSEHPAREYEELSATRQVESGKHLLARLGIAPGECVLDVGCGTGLLALHLADLVGPAGMVLGLDPLPHRIDLAREKTRPNLSFDVGDANDLSKLAQSSFDVIVL